jgi:hypothetical protein
MATRPLGKTAIRSALCQRASDDRATDRLEAGMTTIIYDLGVNYIDMPRRTGAG